MIIGIICGFITAILNSVGYLCSANFLKHYRSPIRLLLFAQIVMMIPSIPAFICIFPFRNLEDPRFFIFSIFAWIIVHRRFISTVCNIVCLLISTLNWRALNPPLYVCMCVCVSVCVCVCSSCLPQAHHVHLNSLLVILSV